VLGRRGIAMTNRIWRRRGQRGQALVEFALILPLLMLVLFGIVEFGRAWNAKQVLTDAAREGARLAVVGDPTITQPIVDSMVKLKIARGGFDVTQVVIEYPDGFRLGTGRITSVAVSMPYRFVVLHRLASLVTNNGVITLRTTARMRNE
ncbi:MAG TPA: TadE family protein, partial [Burkholderiales bacterium]